VTTFKKHARIAADEGMGLRWDVETGQVFVKASEVVKLIDDVDETNFLLDYDCGHAQAVSVLGHNQVQPLEKYENGQLDYINMLEGKIGSVGINDCDNTTVMNEFATHLGMGKGVLDYDQIIPAMIASGFRGPWWAVDSIPMSPDVWTDAWNAREKLSALLDKYL
jgi:sugar phosphate isomerase/epimerase